MPATQLKSNVRMYINISYELACLGAKLSGIDDKVLTVAESFKKIMDIYNNNQNGFYYTNQTINLTTPPNETQLINTESSTSKIPLYPSMSHLLDELGVERIQFSFEMLLQTLQEGPLTEQLANSTKIIHLLTTSKPITLSDLQPLNNNSFFRNATLTEEKTHNGLKIYLPAATFSTGNDHYGHTFNFTNLKNSNEESFYCGRKSPSETFKLTIAIVSLSKIDTGRIKISHRKRSALILDIEKLQEHAPDRSQLEQTPRNSLCKLVILQD